MVSKASALMNTFIGFEPVMVPVKIKMTIQENIMEAQKKIREVGKHFNLMAIWSFSYVQGAK